MVETQPGHGTYGGRMPDEGEPKVIKVEVASDASGTMAIITVARPPAGRRIEGPAVPVERLPGDLRAAVAVWLGEQ